MKSNVKKSTVKKSNGKKSNGKKSAVKVTPVETAPIAEVTPVETAPIAEVTTDKDTDSVMQVTAPVETAPIAEVTAAEVANPNQNEVAIDKKIEEKTDKNKDDSSCPSRYKTPHPPVNKSDYLKETLIFHPDKNTGCNDSANEKFLKLTEMEELRNNPKTSNNITQPNSNGSIDNAEETVTDNAIAIPITNAPNPAELSTTKETDYNNSSIGKFDVSISYPNGLSGSPIVNLIGTQGGDTDAVFGAISKESETPSSQTQPTQDLSKAIGGKSRSRKKNNQSKKPKKPKKHKNTEKNKTMKRRK